MSVVTPTILSEGQEMDPAYQVLSIDVRKEVNRIPSAEIRVLDGDPSEGAFPISESTFFEPGKKIEIRLRYEEAGEDTTVFKGVVLRQGIEVDGRDATLTVEMKDEAVKMTHVRKSQVFLEKSDDKVIGELIQNAGLQKGALEATTPTHAEIVQYDCTDWDLMLSRADVNGLLVVADDGEIALKKIEVTGAPAHTFELGIREIYNLEMETDASHQFQAVEATAWDLKNQKSFKPVKAKAVNLSQGNLDGEKLAKTLKFEPALLSHPVPLVSEELQAWADARMVRSRFSMLRGRIAVAGIPDVKAMDVIEVKGLGTRFNGKTLATGVRHRVDQEGWRTDVQFGLSPKSFSREEGIQAAPAAGLLPAVGGLQLGVVAAFEEDPDGEFRVKVKVPGIDDAEGMLWARLASPDAGLERGFFFRPEVDDEVVLGFLSSDPRQPVILGGMYGSKNKPPEDFSALSEENIHKGIVTKKGTAIGFVDDEKASVFIQTAGENKLLLDDDGEAVVLSDQHGNTITMNADGIEIKSAKDLILDAGGNVEIKGSKVDVK
ncbi:MAG: type VI secretion system tip protein VgrG [Nitrospiria bacterium]